MSGFVFSEKPIEIVEGDGAFVTDSNGTEYLDMGASYACVPLGHGHEAVHDAITDQLSRLTYVQASYPVEIRTKLYELLAETAPKTVDKVWLCNSGTEANEAALKFARAATGNSKIISTKRGFHGRTMGALATTWKNKYKKPYEPLIGDVEFVAYDDAAEMAAAIDDDTAAVIVEPVQGEGGINPARKEFLQRARVETATSGAALIFDEVQTGMGRTGTLWASEWADVVPDMITSAKGLGNGLPVGATLCRDWIADNYGSHASTFSGGPVVSAAVHATVSTIVDEEIPQHAAEMGEYMMREIEAAAEKHDLPIREVRGNGLMVGVEVKRGANRVLRDLALNHRILALPAGRSVVRLLPPLTIEESHVDRVVDALTEALS